MSRNGIRSIGLAVLAWAAMTTPALAQGTVIQKAEDDGTVYLDHQFVGGDVVTRVGVSIHQVKPLQSLTLLDFDRDGRPDALVELRDDGTYTNGAPRGRYNVFRLNRSAYDPATDCFIRVASGNPDTSTLALLASDQFIYSTAGNRRDVDPTVPLADHFGDIARYQPIMVSFSTATASLIEPATDVIPNAAGSGATCLAPNPFGAGLAQGVQVDMAKGTDRGQPAAPARTQAFADLPEADESVADLRSAAIESFDATPTFGSSVGSLGGTTSTRPADLVLRFGPGTGSEATESATYLAPGYTDAQITDAGANFATGITGMVTTEPGVDADRVTVSIYDGIDEANQQLDRLWCQPLDGEGRADLRLRFDLPLQRTLEGERIARVSLDRLLDVFQLGAYQPGTATFRWAATGLPGGVFSPADYAPDSAGAARGGTALGRCDSGKLQLDVATMPRFALTLPSATLTADPAAPARRAQVDFTATGGTRYAFDLGGSGRFTADADGAARHEAGYVRTTLARAMVYDADGTAAMATRTVTPQNQDPAAAIAALEPTYALASGAVSLTFDGGGSTDPDAIDASSQIAGYAWKLFAGASTTPVATGAAETFPRTFTATGTYRVELTVTGADGGTDSAEASFRVVNPPVAALAATDPDPVIAGRPVTLHASTGALYGDDGPLEYAWDVDDDGTYESDTGTTAFHTTEFAARGTQTVGLRVTDAAGRIATAPLEVVVRSLDETPPTAQLSATPATARSGEDDVSFSAAGSVLNNPGGTTDPPTRYRYDFGDGTAPVVTGDASVTHRYAGSGGYEATLVVIDERIDPPSQSVPATAAVTITQGASDANAPVASIERVLPAPDQPVYANRDLRLQASASVVDGPARYAWDLNGDGTFERDTGVEPTITSSYATAGTRTVRVRATDAEGRTGASPPLTIVVRAEPILAPAMALAAPESVLLENGTATVTLDATGSTGRNDDPSLTYTWDADGDGTFERGTGAEPRLAVTFGSRGARTVRVRGRDVYGNTATAVREILVRDATDEAAGCAGGSSYRTVTFGPARAVACWTRAERPSAGPLWIAAGRVDMNGLVLTASGPGATIALDPQAGRLSSEASVSVAAAGSGIDLPLSVGPLDVTLPFAAGDDGFIVRVPSAAKLFGFPITGEAEVRFPTPGTSRIVLTVGMPEGLPGVSGQTEVTATPARGVVVDRLKIEVGTGEFGGQLLVRELGFEYSRPEALWGGSAKLTIPAGKPVDLAIEVKVQNERFKSIRGEVDGLNQPIAKAIFLQRIAAGVAVEPLELSGGIGITAGPKVAGFSLVRADADFRMLFPGAGNPYHVFQLTGTANLLERLPLARAFVQFSDSGFVEARGGIGGDYEVAYFDASIGGWISSDAANFTGDAEVGLLVAGNRVGLLGAHAVVSTVGVAACGEIPVLELGGGIGARWSNFDIATFRGCDLGPYSVARPATAPDQPAGFARVAGPRRPGHLVRLPRGLKSAALEVHGTGGAPAFRVVDARGRTVVDASEEHLTSRSMVLQSSEARVSSLLWKAPRAGRYWVVAAPGSAPIARVRSALGTPPPRVTARVTGRGAVRTLRWRARPRLQAGQRLLLAETSDGAGGRSLVSTTASSGTERFRPVPGLRAGRGIEATVLTDGLGSQVRTVARFEPPALRGPRRPQALDLRRRGRDVLATWRPAAGGPRAKRYRIEARIGSARRVLRAVPGARRSLRLRDIPAAQEVRVAVRGMATSGGHAGGARRALARAGRLRSGRLAAREAVPTRLRARRSGRRLVVRWTRGAEPVRRFEVRVRGRGRTRLVAVHPKRSRAVVRRAPAGRVRIEVRAVRHFGRPMERRLTVTMGE